MKRLNFNKYELEHEIPIDYGQEISFEYEHRCSGGYFNPSEKDAFKRTYGKSKTNEDVSIVFNK